jgi:hypothetical protein
MKAYRKRKALRNAQHQTPENLAGFTLNFGVNKSVFEEESDDRSDDEKTQSVGSVCNTHTKVLYPALNDNNKAA